MKTKVLLFDFDGTLFDTMEVWEHLASMYLKTKGIYVKNIDTKVQSMTLWQGVQYLQKLYIRDSDVQTILLEMRDCMRAYYENQAFPKKGVISFLRKMKKSRMPMYILSSGNRDLIMLLLEKYEIVDMFEELYLCDTLSMDKRSGDVYHHIAKMLKVSTKDICVFEDLVYAAKSAKQAGCKVIGVYDTYQDSKIEKVADIYITEYQELEDSI